MKGPDKTDFMDAASLFEYGFNNFEQIPVEGGSMTLPKGMTADDTTDETFEGPEGKKHVEFYYRQLPVGMADMTQTDYALLRHLEPPVVESVVTEVTSVQETAEAAPAEETAAGETKKKGGGGLVVLIVLIILALAGFGGLLIYRDYQERKRQAERRRKIMERRRKQERKDGDDKRS
jgi:D-alanyl-D-alanine carboxypeptidase